MPDSWEKGQRGLSRSDRVCLRVALALVDPGASATTCASGIAGRRSRSNSARGIWARSMRAIAEAALARDAERVCDLTERHYERTADDVRTGPEDMSRGSHRAGDACVFGAGAPLSDADRTIPPQAGAVQLADTRYQETREAGRADPGGAGENDPRPRRQQAVRRPPSLRVEGATIHRQAAQVHLGSSVRRAAASPPFCG